MCLVNALLKIVKNLSTWKSTWTFNYFYLISECEKRLKEKIYIISKKLLQDYVKRDKIKAVFT